MNPWSKPFPDVPVPDAFKVRFVESECWNSSYRAVPVDEAAMPYLHGHCWGHVYRRVWTGTDGREHGGWYWNLLYGEDRRVETRIEGMSKLREAVRVEYFRRSYVLRWKAKTFTALIERMGRENFERRCGSSAGRIKDHEHFTLAIPTDHFLNTYRDAFGMTTDQFINELFEWEARAR